jgi:hypothetical protein
MTAPLVRHVLSRLHGPDKIKCAILKWLLQSVRHLKVALVSKACSCSKLIASLGLLWAQRDALCVAPELLSYVPAPTQQSAQGTQ